MTMMNMNTKKDMQELDYFQRKRMTLKNFNNASSRRYRSPLDQNVEARDASQNARMADLLNSHADTLSTGRGSKSSRMGRDFLQSAADQRRDAIKH